MFTRTDQRDCTDQSWMLACSHCHLILRQIVTNNGKLYIGCWRRCWSRYDSRWLIHRRLLFAHRLAPPSISCLALLSLYLFILLRIYTHTFHTKLTSVKLNWNRSVQQRGWISYWKWNIDRLRCHIVQNNQFLFLSFFIKKRCRASCTNSI